MRKRDELLEEGSEFGGDEDFGLESDSASMAEEVSSTKNAVNDSGSQSQANVVRAGIGNKRRTMG